MLVGMRQSLIDAGLKKAQRAGVTRILGEVGFIVNHDSNGKLVDSYHLTVGDVRRLSDEQLGKLTGENGVRVLRALFGNQE
jgi:hypothetical protein